MNLRVLPGLLAWTVLSPIATACGPFFRDTVLDKPQAAMAVPLVSYVTELSNIAGVPCPPESPDPHDSTFLAQIPEELKELKQLWTELKVEPTEIERRLTRYAEVRKTLLEDVGPTCINRFPTQTGALVHSMRERPLDFSFPPEVADYVEAARLHAIGQGEQARALWKAILDRPIEQRKLRCIWAAWMLAKTSPDESESLSWYERVEKEAAAGGTDAVGLVAASMGWRAMLTNDLNVKLRLYFEGVRRGHAKDITEVRQCSEAILNSTNPDQLAAAAADPLLRQLIHLQLQAKLDHPRPEIRADHAPSLVPEAWLTAVQQHAKAPLPDGPRLAWALYASGQFDESKHWLDLSDPGAPLALWLRAKFDLRAGKLETAQLHLDAALKKLRATAHWNPGNPHRDAGWSESELMRSKANQGRLFADAGLVALGREDYLQSLELLRQGGYDADAAYIAEHLVSTSSLLKHVKAVAPHDSDRPAGEQGYFERYSLEDAPPEVDPATCLEPDRIGVYQWLRNPDNRLRYELARRLGREGRLDEAIAFMPPQLKKLSLHYADLDRARRSKRYKGPALAAIIWRQARIHRWWGAQLFSTDSSPDGGIYDWGYPAPDLKSMRRFREGWSITWPDRYPTFPTAAQIGPALQPADTAVPRVTADEVRRMSIERLPYNLRYHYRMVAADLAWQAAALLPDDDPNLAPLYHTAGLWAVAGDGGKRFYDAMMKRCPRAEAAIADARAGGFDWQQPHLAELPGFPTALAPKKSDHPWTPRKEPLLPEN
ncbi:hypothetical protein [Luteolibacter sp. LG18]|uniref:hypothetical protein n=1 Tax=Luteolibacter sp. LG18 TaxID=2819286 RepID=UPI002B2B69C4|nr:hypothetical protein llg_01520 [Luteolibacter sp. LG18]